MRATVHGTVFQFQRLTTRWGVGHGARGVHGNGMGAILQLHVCFVTTMHDTFGACYLYRLVKNWPSLFPGRFGPWDRIQLYVREVAPPRIYVCIVVVRGTG